MKSYSLPLTSIVVRAIDSFQIEEQRQLSIEKLVRYIHTDSTIYMQEYPSSFVTLQKNHWEPLHAWLLENYSIKMVTTTGLVPIQQPLNTITTLKSIISAYEPFKLAAFEKAVLRSRSFMIGFALIEDYISVDEAVIASNLEVIQQTNKVTIFNISGVSVKMLMMLIEKR